MFEAKAKNIIEDLIPSLLEAICTFPKDVLPQVKNMTLYIEYLESFKSVISFFTFMLKRNFSEKFFEKLDDVLSV